MNTTKDARYYESLMEEKANALREEMTSGMSIRDMMEIEDELEERTFLPRLLAEVARGLPEARAMVSALREPLNGPVELTWVKVYPGYEYGQLGHARMTREQIINRLQEISFLDFGDDPEEWSTWLAAFEADPPMTGYR